MKPKTKKQNNKKQNLFTFTKILLIGFGILLFLSFVSPIKHFINLNILFFITLGFSAFSVLFYLKPKKTVSFKQKKKIQYENDILKYIFLFALILICVPELFNLFKANWVKNIQIFFESIQTEILLIAIASGGIYFYLNKDKINKDTKESEEKQRTSEQKRKQNFSQAHPKLNSIPILKLLFRWMYKEGWWYGVSIIIIFLVFVGIRLRYIFLFPDVLHDSWYQVAAAVDFFKTGHFHEIANYFPNNYYLRGAPISFIVALFWQIFGKSLYVAQMVPTFIGALSFIFVYKISRRLIYNKHFFYIIALIFTFLPWCIYNHIYIRMYVGYELYFLVLIFIFIKISESLKKENWKTFYISTIFLIILNYLNYFWSYDSGKSLVLFATGMGLGYIFLFQINKIPITFKLKKFVKLKMSYKILILIFAIVLGWFLFDVNSKIYWLLNFQSNTASYNIKHWEFFFDINGIFMIFYLIALFSLFYTKKHWKMLVGVLSGSLLLIHFISNPELQMIRGIMYHLPIFIIISILGFSYFCFIFFRENKLRRILFSSIFLVLFALTVINNYPEDFTKVPQIPGETGYMEQIPIFKYIKQKKKDHVVIYVSTEMNPLVYYNLSIDYQLDLEKYLSSSQNYFFEENVMKNIATNVPVIRDRKTLNNLINNKKLCIIIPEFATGRLITTEDYKTIVENMKRVKKTNSVELFCN